MFLEFMVFLIFQINGGNRVRHIRVSILLFSSQTRDGKKSVAGIRYEVTSKLSSKKYQEIQRNLKSNIIYDNNEKDYKNNNRNDNAD